MCLPICLDAYEASADLSYFTFARKIAEAMIAGFHDAAAGGFTDLPSATPGDSGLGALSARRKPLQDSPTPAGNPAAAMALARLYAYTNDSRYRDIVENTLSAFAGIAGHYGLFAATYGLALTMHLRPHTQVVITGAGEQADRLHAAALAHFSFNHSVVRVRGGQAVPQMLPPALADTLPSLPAIQEGKAAAVICSGFSCRPPISEPAQLEQALREAVRIRDAA